MKKLSIGLLAWGITAVLLAGCGSGQEGGGGDTKPVQSVGQSADSSAAAPETSQETAQSGGSLVVYSPNVDEIMNTLIPMFENETGIKVEVVSAGAGELMKRIESEKENPYADVIFGGYVTDADYFEEYVSVNLPDLLVDQENTEPFRTPYIANGSCLLVNENLAGEIPINGYADLLNPDLKGKIVSGDPVSSSSAYRQLTNILLAMGGYESEEAWDYVDKLVQNLDGKILNSSGAVHKGVVEGEYVVALTYEDPCANYVKSGAPVRIVFPEEGAVFLESDIGIVKGAPNQENARKFVDFITSKEAQSIFGTELTNRPLHKEAEIGDHLIPYSEINLLTEDVEYCQEHKAEILDRWKDIIINYE